MALSQSTRAAIAFKKLSGFINSSGNTSFFSEVVPSQITIATQEVIGQEIPSDPTTLSNKKKIQLELVKNSASGFSVGKGYELAIPQGTSLDLPSGTVTVDDGSNGGDPLNRLVRDFRVSGGGRRSVQIISQKFNLQSVNDSSPGYGYVFFSDVGNNDVISRADDSQWQADPVAGIVTSQLDLRSNEGLSTTTEGSVVPDAALECYLFTGPTLEYRVSNLSGGGGGTTGLQDTQGPGIVVFDENASTGEKSLAYDATEVITNGGSSGSSSGVVSSGTGVDVDTDSTGNQNDSANYDVTYSVDHEELSNKAADANTVTGHYMQKGLSGDAVSEATYGTYNFNGNSVVNVGSGTFEADGSNNEVTISASNATLNSNGTLKIDDGAVIGSSISGQTPNSGEVIAVDFTETSSLRYKTNVSEFGRSALDIIRDLTLRTFQFEGRDGQQIGLIAEEVFDTLPELVSTDDDGRPRALNYGKLSPIAIRAVNEAVQEFREENERLRERVRELETRIQ